MSTRTLTPADHVRDMYTCAINGDMAAFFDHLGEDLVLEEPPFLPYGGTYHGHAGMQQVLGEALKVLDLSTLKIVEIFGDDSCVCAVVTMNLIGTGEPRTILEHWRVSGGKARWVRVFWFDPRLS